MEGVELGCFSPFSHIQHRERCIRPHQLYNAPPFSHTVLIYRVGQMCDLPHHSPLPDLNQRFRSTYFPTLLTMTRFGSIFSSSEKSSRAPSRASTFSGTSNKHRELVLYDTPPRSSASRSRGRSKHASTHRPTSANRDESDGYQSDGGATALQMRGAFDGNAPRDYFWNPAAKDLWDAAHPPKEEPPREVRDPERTPRHPATEEREACDTETLAPSGVSTIHPPRRRRHRSVHPSSSVKSRSVNYEEGEEDDLGSVAPNQSISQVSDNRGDRYRPATERRPPPPRSGQPLGSTTSGSTAYSVTSTQMEKIVARAVQEDRDKRRRR